MTTMMSFAILGFLFGIYLSVFGLLVLMVPVLAIYGGAVVLMSGTTGSDLAMALLMAAFALQVGYFVCVVLRIVITRFRTGTAAITNAPPRSERVQASGKNEPSQRSWTGWLIRRTSERHW
jgi:hypothetical protein